MLNGGIPAIRLTTSKMMTCFFFFFVAFFKDILIIQTDTIRAYDVWLVQYFSL